MKYHEKPAHFRELFSNLLPILLALFIWTNPVLAQNNGELITLSLKNNTTTRLFFEHRILIQKEKFQ